MRLHSTPVKKPRLRPGMSVRDRQTRPTSRHLLPARSTVVVVEICPCLFSCFVCACLGHWQNHGRSVKLVSFMMKTFHPQHSTRTTRSRLRDLAVLNYPPGLQVPILPLSWTHSRPEKMPSLTWPPGESFAGQEAVRGYVGCYILLLNLHFKPMA